jgi:beta-galactosidase
MRTAGAPARIKLEPDRAKILADGLDLSFVTVSVTDADGKVAPRANNRLRFAMEGPGEIVATDNGDPTSFESFQSHDREAFNGLCLVIVRGKVGQPGKIKLIAAADTLRTSAITLTTTSIVGGSPR